MMRQHQETKADATIAAIPVKDEQTSGFGLISMSDEGLVTGFVEKPKTVDERSPYLTKSEWIAARGIEPHGRNYLANMGIYAFKTDVLLELLTAKPLATDFGKEVFPRNYKSKRIFSHLFDGYWEDLGTIKSYHESSLALAGANPPFDFFSQEGLIYTRMRNLPASRINGATLEHSLVADGCVVGPRTRLENSLLGVRSRIGCDCILRDTVVIGSDGFETDADRAENARRGRPNLNIGDGSIIARAILDKDCRIGKRVKLTNESRKEEADGPNGIYYIRDGIICVPRGVIIPDGTVV
jgi:glucose-1-phosphate adenylyltransferase